MVTNITHITKKGFESFSNAYQVSVYLKQQLDFIYGGCFSAIVGKHFLPFFQFDRLGFTYLKYYHYQILVFRLNPNACL